MNNILKQIPSKGKIKTIFKRIIFGSHVHCPYCKSRSIRIIRSEERWRCCRCDHPFSIKSSSWLKGSKLSLEQIWIILWCWQKEFSIKHTMMIAGLSYTTTYTWYKRFRDNIPKALCEIVLSNEVVCDELYTKNNSVIGAKEKGSRNIVLKVLYAKSVTKTDAFAFLTRYTTPNSNLYTDGSSIYKGINQWHNITHTYELHKKWEFSLTSEIEGLWGVFRTFIRKMYHHVTRYTLGAIVSEFTLRFRQHKIFESPLTYLEICLSTKSI